MLLSSRITEDLKLGRHRNPGDRYDLLGGVKELRNLLENNGYKFALAGALAQLCHVESRNTEDIDIIILSDVNKKALGSLMDGMGYRVDFSGWFTTDLMRMVQQIRFIGPLQNPVKVDFLVSSNEFWRYAISHATWCEKLGIDVIDVNSLAAMKYVASQDLHSLRPWKKHTYLGDYEQLLHEGGADKEVVHMLVEMMTRR